jgi:hypothetical protein
VNALPCEGSAFDLRAEAAALAAVAERSIVLGVFVGSAGGIEHDGRLSIQALPAGRATGRFGLGEYAETRRTTK